MAIRCDLNSVWDPIYDHENHQAHTIYNLNHRGNFVFFVAITPSGLKLTALVLTKPCPEHYKLKNYRHHGRQNAS